ncbi:hypothetical protein KAU04_05285 [bacterium]|nr:hypothetical protein [bacterium]MCK4597428.1 hypothetical protein [bacterium]
MDTFLACPWDADQDADRNEHEPDGQGEEKEVMDTPASSGGEKRNQQMQQDHQDTNTCNCGFKF